MPSAKAETVAAALANVDERDGWQAHFADTMTGEASTFPTLTPELLDDVVQCILEVGSPRRIVRSALPRRPGRLQTCRAPAAFTPRCAT